MRSQGRMTGIDAVGLGGASETLPAKDLSTRSGPMKSIKRFLPFALRALSLASPRLAGRLSLELFLRPKRHARPPNEEDFWRKGEPLVFSSGARGRRYGRVGQQIWFVHGWEGRSSQFYRMIETCVAAGYVAIAWDGPAHGDSPGRRTNVIHFSRQLRSDMVSYLGAGGQALALVGHSFGGIACGFACKEGAPVEKLVVIASPLHIPEFMEKFWKWIRLPLAARRAFRERIEFETGEDMQSASFLGFHHLLKQKILIVQDLKDRDVDPRHALRLREERNDIRFLITEGLGHRRILQAPEVATELMRFLAQK